MSRKVKNGAKMKPARKSVRLKRQRDGGLRKHWYGQYQDGGTHHEVNLNVRWNGTPPPYLLGTGKGRQGDAAFETSRRKAETALAAFVDEAQHKGRAEHLTELLIESKTGRSVEYARLTDLKDRWRSLGREAPVSKRYLSGCDARFARFTDFMQKRNPTTVYLYEVTSEDVAAFATDVRNRLAQSTAGATVRLLNKAFSRFLPVGAENPFSAFVGNRGNSQGETIHRKPFTHDELKAVLDAAQDDDLMLPLITAAACTGLRRGDVCKLKWSAVNWKEGMLVVKTGKTGTDVEIPIFSPLLRVLKERKGAGKGYIFPAAARMLKENPNGLSFRFKKIVARALYEAPPGDLPKTVPPATIKTEATRAIKQAIPEGQRRDRMLVTLQRYADGQSYKTIKSETESSLSQISEDLHIVEELIEKKFVRVQAPSIRNAIRATTQAERKNGQRAASVRDWHALRTTWVTNALIAGVPESLVRRVTGHATVDVVQENYFRPDREHFRAVLTNAMPSILTGGKQKRLKPADELAELAVKVASQTATKEDKSRLRTLAAKVK